MHSCLHKRALCITRHVSASQGDDGPCLLVLLQVDDRFPPENILDGKDATFWMTTGMFPQECVLSLKAGVKVSKITTLSLGGKPSVRVRSARTSALTVAQVSDGPTGTTARMILIYSAWDRQPYSASTRLQR